MSMTQHSYEQERLEGIAQIYVGHHRNKLVPLLIASIVCGMSWGVLGVQYISYLARTTKGQSKVYSWAATYLMFASTAYLGLFATYISWLFAYNFGTFAAAFDLTYSSWLFLLGTAFIHVPSQLYFIHVIYRLSGQKRVLALVLITLTIGILAFGVTIKAMLPDFLTGLDPTLDGLIKAWIAVGTATDVAISTTMATLLFMGKSKQFKHASTWGKIGYLLVEAQLTCTLLSAGLLGLLMWSTSTELSHLWLGFPLIYAITVVTSLASKVDKRESLELEAQSTETLEVAPPEEKCEIPLAEHRPSFKFATFPTISIRRASQGFTDFISPVTIPAMNGVRRASQFLGVIPPPGPRNLTKRTFPFKRKTDVNKVNKSNMVESRDERGTEMHPTCLHYPLSSQGATMGASENGRGLPVGLERQHSLALFDSDPQLLSISMTDGASTFNSPSGFPLPPSPTGSSSSDIGPDQIVVRSNDRSPSLHDPFAESGAGISSEMSKSHSSSSFRTYGRPTMQEALEAHEIFEFPGTPNSDAMFSPKSSASPMLPTVDQVIPPFDQPPSHQWN